MSILLQQSADKEMVGGVVWEETGSLFIHWMRGCGVDVSCCNLTATLVTLFRLVQSEVSMTCRSSSDRCMYALFWGRFFLQSWKSSIKMQYSLQRADAEHAESQPAPRNCECVLNAMLECHPENSKYQAPDPRRYKSGNPDLPHTLTFYKLKTQAELSRFHQSMLASCLAFSGSDHSKFALVERAEDTRISA
jgi:hypothetical protein